MDTSTLQDPLGSDDASSNPANEMNDELSDASQELNNQVLVDKTICTKSRSEERLSDSVSDRCVSPSSTSHGPQEMINEIEIAPSVDDKLHPSSETAFSDPGSAENRKKKCHSFAAMNCDASELDINTVLDSELANNTPSSKEVYMNDAHEVPEVVPSGNLSEENITKENTEDAEVAGSVRNCADESLLPVRSDLNGKIACEEEKNLHLNTEVASNEMYFDESGINASGESSEVDPV